MKKNQEVPSLALTIEQSSVLLFRATSFLKRGTAWSDPAETLPGRVRSDVGALLASKNRRLIAVDCN